MAQLGPWILRLLKPRKIFLEDGMRPLDDLAFLRRHAGTVQELRIQGDGLVDLESVHALGKLSLLSIDADGATETLELRRFPQLQSLAIHGDIAIDWTDCSPKLSIVSLEQGSQADAQAMSQLPQLSVAILADSWIPASFAGPLEDLWIERPAGWLGNAIEGLDQLSRLRLDDSDLTDLRKFELASSLELVAIFGAAQLQSLAGLTLVQSETAFLGLTNCPLLADRAGLEFPADTTIENCPLLER